MNEFVKTGMKVPEIQKIKTISGREMETFNMRVRSWLRMNAGGVPNTCKSNGDADEASADETS